MKKILSALCAAALASTAQAATIFSDNFDAAPLGLNSTPPSWTVSAGTVDTIGSPSFFDLIPGNGRYIDLDGSSSNAGILSRALSPLPQARSMSPDSTWRAAIAGTPIV